MQEKKPKNGGGGNRLNRPKLQSVRGFRVSCEWLWPCPSTWRQQSLVVVGLRKDVDTKVGWIYKGNFHIVFSY